jgi:hypothetical protein
VKFESADGGALPRRGLNLLDENFPQDQGPLLKEWRIPFRQVGREFAVSGLQDSDIIPLLHRHRGTTFLTQDEDFGPVFRSFKSTIRAGCRAGLPIFWHWATVGA